MTWRDLVEVGRFVCKLRGETVSDPAPFWEKLRWLAIGAKFALVLKWQRWRRRSDGER